MRMNESVVRRFPSFPLLPWNWICFVEINWTQTSVCVYLLHQVRTAVPHLAKEKRRFYELESTFESIHPRGAGSKSRPTKQFRNQSDKITSHVFAYVSAHTTTFHDVCCWAGSSFPVRVGIGFSTFIFPSLCNSLSVESTLFWLPSLTDCDIFREVQPGCVDHETVPALDSHMAAKSRRKHSSFQFPPVSPTETSVTRQNTTAVILHNFSAGNLNLIRLNI